MTWAEQGPRDPPHCMPPTTTGCVIIDRRSWPLLSTNLDCCTTTLPGWVGSVSQRRRGGLGEGREDREDREACVVARTSKGSLSPPCSSSSLLWLVSGVGRDGRWWPPRRFVAYWECESKVKIWPTQGVRGGLHMWSRCRLARDPYFRS